MSEQKAPDLQAQLDQANQQIKGLLAQCDAAKQMHNEVLNSCLQLRTNLNLMSQSQQESNQKLAEFQQQIQVLVAQNKVLADKVLELSPPKVDEELKEPTAE